jgi:hypothetical protein
MAQICEFKNGNYSMEATLSVAEEQWLETNRQKHNIPIKQNIKSFQSA